MPFMFVIAPCVACGVTITFNPERVPSLRVNGSREPLCRGCHARWNEIHRLAHGLEPLPIPEGAYEPEEVA